MKKKILILCMVFIVTTIITLVFAVNGDNINLSLDSSENPGILYKEETNADIIEIQGLDKNDRINMLKDVIANNNLLAMLEDQNLYLDEYNTSLSYFIRIATLYNMTDEEVSIICSMVKNGYDLYKLSELFVFSLDTEYPREFEFIKNMYDMSIEMKIDSKYWKEAVYTGITSGIHGGLNQSEIQSFVNLGVSIEEIYMSDIISRNGRLTISDILERRVNGEKWNTIAEDIYAERGMQSVSYEKIDDISKIYEYALKSYILGVDINLVPENIDKYNDAIKQKNQIAAEVMGELDVTTVITDKIIDQACEISGLSENETKKLLENGYSVRDIAEAAEESQMKNCTIESVLY